MATQKMLKFVTVDRDMPAKRTADDRRKDFDEIYADYAREKAAEKVYSDIGRLKASKRKSGVTVT